MQPSEQVAVLARGSINTYKYRSCLRYFHLVLGELPLNLGMCLVWEAKILPLLTATAQGGSLYCIGRACVESRALLCKGVSSLRWPYFCWRFKLEKML